MTANNILQLKIKNVWNNVAKIISLRTYVSQGIIHEYMGNTELSIIRETLSRKKMKQRPVICLFFQK
jgi:hypothetical protein